MSFAHFLVELLVFFTVESRYSLYILDTNSYMRVEWVQAAQCPSDGEEGAYHHQVGRKVPTPRLDFSDTTPTVVE